MDAEQVAVALLDELLDVVKKAFGFGAVARVAAKAAGKEFAQVGKADTHAHVVVNEVDVQAVGGQFCHEVERGAFTEMDGAVFVCGVVMQAKAGFGGGEDSGDFGVATEVIAYLDAPGGWYFHVQPLRVVMSGDDYRAGLAVLSGCRALQPV